MSTTITLKNVPDELHERLKAAAVSHRRSINNEAIVCLEAVLGGQPVPVAERIERARALRDSLGNVPFDPHEIDALKREGRS